MPSVSPIKLCIDPGHGLGNRKPGLYDPGCLGNGLEEADIALAWGEELARAVEARGIQTFFTRRDKKTECPVGKRAGMASAAGCTHLISIHVNDATNVLATGIETLYNDDERFASDLQSALTGILALRDRGVKHRPDLAVLKFRGVSALLELGFIKNRRDMDAVTSNALMRHACRVIAQTLA